MSDSMQGANSATQFEGWTGRSGLPTLRVATFNLLCTDEPTLERRAVEAASHLGDCDVVLIQEAAFNARVNGTRVDSAQILADELGMQVVTTGVNLVRGATTTGVAILTSLPTREGAAHDFADGVSGQYVSAVVEAGESQYGFLTTHLGWGGQREGVRLQQAVEMNLLADQMMTGANVATVFLGGDLNTEPDSATSGFLRGVHPVEGHESLWVDAWRAVGEGPGFTQTPDNVWARGTALSVGIYDPQQIPPRRIDYLYSRGFAYGRVGAPLRAEVRGRMPKTGIHASDHLALVVDFATPESIRAEVRP